MSYHANIWVTMAVCVEVNIEAGNREEAHAKAKQVAESLAENKFEGVTPHLDMEAIEAECEAEGVTGFFSDCYEVEDATVNRVATRDEIKAAFEAMKKQYREETANQGQ
jgi:hypothetical protein